MKIIVIVALVVLAIAVFVAARRKPTTASREPQPSRPTSADAWKQTPSATTTELKVDGKRLMLVPESQSDARASAVLPTQGSEKASHILFRPVLEPRRPSDSYEPDERVEWVVDIAAPVGRTLRTAEVEAAFNTEWQRANPTTIYGRAMDGKWTFVGAIDAPDVFDRIAFGKRLVAIFPEDPILKEEDMQQFLKAVQAQAQTVMGLRSVSPRYPVRDAATRARTIAALRRACDIEVAVVLVAPEGKPFDGKLIWDVMLSLGLRWGDMDVFHWDNKVEVGDSSLFSVWTSTPPGYFLPEEVAAGRVKTQDIVLGFSVPRSPEPAHVFAQMVKAASYCQRRLGGQLRNKDGSVFDADKSRAVIDGVVRQLKEAGFPPGHDQTLRVF